MALLVSLVVAGMALRFPATPHELGYDAFIFHGMTLSLAQNGQAEWVLNPLSYFGLYPLSQPSGSIFTLASLSLVANFPVEGGVLLFDWVAAIIGTLGAFILSMEFRRDEVMALLVGATFSLAPRYVTGLMWELPTRTMFTTLIPFFLFFLLRWYHHRDARWLGLTAITLLMMVSFHRLSVLMAVVLIAFILTAIVLVIAKTLRIQYAAIVLSRRFRRVEALVALSAFFVVSASLLVVGGVLPHYAQGQLGSGADLISESTNLAVSITRSTGFLVVLLPLGVVATYQMRGKEFKELFLVIVLVLLVPTLTLRQYTGYYITPVTALFTGVAIWWIVSHVRRRSVRLAVISMALAATVVSSVVVVTYDLQSSPFIGSESYVDGLYASYTTRGTIISNDGVLASEVFLVSGHPCLPVGGATTAYQSPELLIYGFVNRSSLDITPVPLSQLTLESDSIFDLRGVQAELDWATLLNSPRGAVASRVWKTYQPQYLLEDKTLAGQYTAYGNRYASPFIASVHEESYMILSLAGESLWYIGGNQ